MAKHIDSPLTIRMVDGKGRPIYPSLVDSAGHIIATAMTEANARRLAHCWNVHDDLVAALEAFLACPPKDRHNIDLEIIVEAALAKAREEESAP